MKNIRRFWLNTALALGFTTMLACEKGFEDINTDPNRISDISPGTLLNPTIYGLASFNMEKCDDITFELMQVMMPFPSPGNGIHRYDILENTGSSTWTTYYRWLNNLREMRIAAEKANDPNYRAIALTLEAWTLANLTDVFGPIPMDEANQAEEGNLQPRYNTQQEVYTSVLARLDTANALYNSARPMSFGTDILYANNVANWKRFTNSLKMRSLLRLANRPEANAYVRIREMMANATASPVFTANDQAAVLRLTGVTPLVSPWGRPQDFTTFKAAGQFFLDSLNAMNDPRRTRFASQARNLAGNTNIGFRGIQHGYAGSENQFAFIPSNLQQALIVAPMIIPMMSYAEVEFIRSEVHLQAGMVDSARACYERGTRAAMEMWGVALPATYFATPAAAFNGTLARIHLQKYYALFFTDFQAWFEHRRTGFPVLPKADGMLNNKQMPNRLLYPVSQRIYNSANYQKAIGTIGGDVITAKAYWQN